VSDLFWRASFIAGPALPFFRRLVVVFPPFCPLFSFVELFLFVALFSRVALLSSVDVCFCLFFFFFLEGGSSCFGSWAGSTVLPDLRDPPEASPAAGCSAAFSGRFLFRLLTVDASEILACGMILVAGTEAEAICGTELVSCAPKVLACGATLVSVSLVVSFKDMVPQRTCRQCGEVPPCGLFER